MYNKQVCQNPQQMTKSWEIIQAGHRGCKSCEKGFSFNWPVKAIKVVCYLCPWSVKAVKSI